MFPFLVNWENFDHGCAFSSLQAIVRTCFEAIRGPARYRETTTRSNFRQMLPCFVIIFYLVHILVASGEILITPAFLRSSDVRSAPTELMIRFSGNDSLVSVVGPAPTFQLTSSEAIASPHGVTTYWESICTFPCVSIKNTTLAVLSLNQEAEFDTIGVEVVHILFERVYFTDKHIHSVSLSILRDDVSGTVAGTVLGTTFQLAVLANSFMLPTMFDAQLIALFLQRPCQMAEQTQWFPTSPELSFLMPGSTVFDRSWRAVVVLGGIVFLGVCALGLFPRQLHSRTAVRAVLPLVLIQVINLWAPPLLFASIYLISFGIASHQIWGAFLFLGIVGMGISSSMQLYADPSFFMTHGSSSSTDSRSIGAKIYHSLFVSDGRWVNPRYCILAQKGDQSVLFHTNRLLLPYYFGKGSMRNHLIFLLGNVLVIIGTGIQGRSPTGCFAQGCCITGYVFLSSFALLKMEFKSTPVRVLTFLIRLVVCGQLVGLVANPNDSFHLLFMITASIAIVLLVARALVVGVGIYADGLTSVCEPEPDVKSATLLDLSRSARSPSVDMGSIRESISDDDIGGVAVGFASIGSSIDKRLASQREGPVLPDDEQRPQWITEASSSKPRAKKSDQLGAPVPLWYPQHRSNVRTTNEADTELDLSPYTVRTSARRQ